MPVKVGRGWGDGEDGGADMKQRKVVDGKMKTTTSLAWCFWCDLGHSYSGNLSHSMLVTKMESDAALITELKKKM